MSEKSVAPLIEAARALELSTQPRNSGEFHFVAACDSLRDTKRARVLPGIRIAPHSLRGPRVEVSRSVRGTIATTAYWPQDGLVATRFPILCGVLRGAAALPMGEYCIQAPAPSLVFIPAGIAHPDGSQPHLSGKSETDFCDLFWLYRWEGGLICHLCHSHGNVHTNFHTSENCFLIGRQSTIFFDLFANAVAAQHNLESGQQSDTSACALPYLLPALLAVIGADLKAGHYVQPGVLPEGEDAEQTTAGQAHPAKWKENFGAITRAQNYIMFHSDQPLSLDAMAQMSFMSRAQFTRRFRQETGRSFVQFVTEVRIEHAKLFLTGTDWSVEVIAQAVGMRPSHFWNVFTRHCQVPPGEFRQRSRQKPKGGSRGIRN